MSSENDPQKNRRKLLPILVAAGFLLLFGILVYVLFPKENTGGTGGGNGQGLEVVTGELPSTEKGTGHRADSDPAKQTEEGTSQGSESVTETPTEPKTEKQTEPKTEKQTEPKTEKQTEPKTDGQVQQELKFRSKKLLDQHFEKHGRDMGFSDTKAYVKAANEVINDPACLHKIEKEDGDDVYYRESDNAFVVVSRDGYIRTFFYPDGGKKYYDRQ